MEPAAEVHYSGKANPYHGLEDNNEDGEEANDPAEGGSVSFGD